MSTAYAMHGLHIDLSEVGRHAARIRVVGSRVTYRTLTVAAGHSVRLPGYTLTVVRVHGSGIHGYATVRVVAH